MRGGRIDTLLPPLTIEKKSEKGKGPSLSFLRKKREWGVNGRFNFFLTG